MQPIFVVGPVLSWRERYVQKYCFCTSCLWMGSSTFQEFLGGKGMFLCFLKTSLWTWPYALSWYLSFPFLSPRYYLELYPDSVFRFGIGWYFPVFSQPIPDENLAGTFRYCTFGGNPFFPSKGGFCPLFDGPSPPFEGKISSR
jgi:hypothetical protein